MLIVPRVTIGQTRAGTVRGESAATLLRTVAFFAAASEVWSLCCIRTSVAYVVVKAEGRRG